MAQWSFYCLLLVSVVGAQNVDLFDQWIAHSDRQFAQSERGGLPVAAFQQSRNGDSGLPDIQMQDPTGLSQIEDQLNHNFQNLDRIQATKQQSIRKIDAQIQRQNPEVSLTSTTPHPATEESAQDASEEPTTKLFTKKHKKHATKRTTASVDDAEEESTSPLPTIHHDFLSLKKASSTLKSASNLTAEEVSKNERENAPPTARSTTIKSGTSTAASDSLDRLPRTWVLPENSTLEMSPDPVVKALDAQLQENWKKIEKFKGLQQENSSSTHSPTKGSNVTENSVDEKEEIVDEETTTTTIGTTMHRRKGPFKKASWTKLQEVPVKVPQKTLKTTTDGSSRFAAEAEPVKVALHAKQLAMIKRALNAEKEKAGLSGKKMPTAAVLDHKVNATGDNDTVKVEWERIYALRDDKPLRIFPGVDRNSTAASAHDFSHTKSRSNETTSNSTDDHAKMGSELHKFPASALLNLTQTATKPNTTKVATNDTNARIPKVANDNDSSNPNENDSASDNAEEIDATTTQTATEMTMIPRVKAQVMAILAARKTTTTSQETTEMTMIPSVKAQVQAILAARKMMNHSMAENVTTTTEQSGTTTPEFESENEDEVAAPTAAMTTQSTSTASTTAKVLILLASKAPENKKKFHFSEKEPTTEQRTTSASVTEGKTPVEAKKKQSTTASVQMVTLPSKALPPKKFHFAEKEQTKEQGVKFSLATDLTTQSTFAAKENSSAGPSQAAMLPPKKFHFAEKEQKMGKQRMQQVSSTMAVMVSTANSETVDELENVEVVSTTGRTSAQSQTTGHPIQPSDTLVADKQMASTSAPLKPNSLISSIVASSTTTGKSVAVGDDSDDEVEATTVASTFHRSLP
ncbi:hypothetical protein BV898_00228 [Hypsibius exemplaris]|uniref:Uncharacterized protein n=1 Tax=Hypsibius exemplaris TaxID=2072580 RepID=A0A1W0XFF7_HYPEX|nr:hypothetical protein BV898_00228 [Hypsibius exemplaris]